MKGKIMDTYNIISYVSGGISTLVSALLENPIIQGILCSLSVLLVVLNIISTIIGLVKKAKEDGKITLDETKDIIDGAADAIKDGLDSIKGKDEKEDD